MKLSLQFKSVAAAAVGFVVFVMSIGAQADARIQRHLLRAMETAAAPDQDVIVSRVVDDERVFNVYLLLDDLERTPQRSMADSVRVLRSRAASLQNLALDSLQRPLVDTVTRRYAVLPALSAELTAAQIRQVAKSPYITDITAWGRLQPQWMEAQELTGVTALAEGPQGLTGEGAVIAIIDNGFDAMHPSLGGAPFPNSKLIGGIDLGDGDNDPSFAVGSTCAPQRTVTHGSYVAAIAAGAEVLVDQEIAGGVALRGVAPNASLVGIKYLGGLSTPNQAGLCQRPWEVGNPTDMLQAIEWLALNREALGIDIVSISYALAGGGDILETSAAACDSDWPVVSNGFRMLEEQGLIIFAAAGNFGAGQGVLFAQGKKSLSAPSCLSSVISVGSTYAQTVTATTECTMDDTLSEFNYCTSATCVTADHVQARSSNAGFLDLLAPGVFQTHARTTHFDPSSSDDSGLQYDTCALGGTSFASPNAAGIAALMVEKAGKGALSQADMHRLLTTTGCCVTDNNSWPQITKPRVDALNAALLLDQDEDEDGVADIFDNCLDLPNADQRDTDNDGDGNLCDADLNNDGIVSMIDFNIMRLVFYTRPAMWNWDPDADLDGDDFVSFSDLSILGARMGTKPGPSGYTSFPEACGFSTLANHCPDVVDSDCSVPDPGAGNVCALSN